MKKSLLIQKTFPIKQLFLVALIGILLLSFNSCLFGEKKGTKNEGESEPQPEIGSIELVNENSTTNNFFGANAAQVPHDVPTIADSTQVALSTFAWQEFIALNWPSTYNTTSHERGKPDLTKSIADFLSPPSTGQLVWQTYKHRVEMYPRDTTKFVNTFDSAPQYFYDLESGQKSILGLNSTKPLSTITTIFNNLDETSEINLCTLFVEGDSLAPGASKYKNPDTASGLPGAPRRMIYEAKGNRDMFDYVKNYKLYDSLTRVTKIKNTEKAIKNDGKGAVYPNKNADSTLIVFPFGDNNGVEGSIEVKATWRQLTLKEYNSKRYLTAPIIYYRNVPKNGKSVAYYDIVPGEPTYDTNNTLKTLPYGLVGLHIIHKTKTFPSYVFATFEQVDNLSTTVEPLNTLFFYNRNNDLNTNKQYVFDRSKPILEGTKQVNAEVHKQIRALAPNSVWQYYKLIGVQGHPQNNANTTDYFLSNIVTETNQTLRNFAGTLNNNTGLPDLTAINLYQGKKVFVQGGCKGCHGNAQDADFSFITKNAPFDGEPDFINQPLIEDPEGN